MVLGACLIALVAGCVIGELAGEETAGETGEAPAEPGARVVGQVDVIELCGTNEAYAVSFRARKIGCEPGPPAPCTIRTDPYEEVVGDAATCPASHNSLEMAVVVGSAGRWQIEAVTLTSSGSIGRCFGPGTAEVTVVTDEQVAARATVPVSQRAGPCPAP